MASDHVFFSFNYNMLGVEAESRTLFQQLFVEWWLDIILKPVSIRTVLVTYTTWDFGAVNKDCGGWLFRLWVGLLELPWDLRSKLKSWRPVLWCHGESPLWGHEDELRHRDSTGKSWKVLLIPQIPAQSLHICFSALSVCVFICPSIHSYTAEQIIHQPKWGGCLRFWRASKQQTIILSSVLEVRIDPYSVFSLLHQNNWGKEEAPLYLIWPSGPPNQILSSLTSNCSFLGFRRNLFLALHRDPCFFLEVNPHINHSRPSLTSKNQTSFGFGTDLNETDPIYCFSSGITMS